MKSDISKQGANATTVEDVFGLALQTLNEAYEADPAAMHALICNRVPCNQTLADHPTIQCGVNNITPTETFEVGLLGVINGIIERITGKRVAARFSIPDADGRSKIVGFRQYATKDA